jgi:hypothetical protein
MGTHTMSIWFGLKTRCNIEPIECTSIVTRIALNLECPEMAHVSYIEGDVPILGLTHFLEAGPDHSKAIIPYLCCMREAVR